MSPTEQSISLALSQTSAYTVRPQIWGLVHHTVCLLSPQLLLVLTGPSCGKTERQAELTWVADYTIRQFTHSQMVTLPSTNRA